MDGGRIAGQSQKERFLLETKVTLMRVLHDQVEVKVRAVPTDNSTRWICQVCG